MTVTATSGVNPALSTTVSTSGRSFVLTPATSSLPYRLQRHPAALAQRAPRPGGPRRRAVANLLYRGLV